MRSPPEIRSPSKIHSPPDKLPPSEKRIPPKVRSSLKLLVRASPEKKPPPKTSSFPNIPSTSKMRSPQNITNMLPPRNNFDPPSKIILFGKGEQSHTKYVTLTLHTAYIFLPYRLKVFGSLLQSSS